MGEPLKIGGIKFSAELALFNLPGPSDSRSSLSPCLQILAQNRINLPFVSIGRRQDRLWLSGCVAADEMDRVRHLFGAQPQLPTEYEIIDPVGLLTLFPHQAGLKLLGLALTAFGRAQLPVYGMASSLAALTFVTDYARLDRAVECLQAYIVLPPNHTPFKPEFRVKHVTR